MIKIAAAAGNQRRNNQETGNKRIIIVTIFISFYFLLFLLITWKVLILKKLLTHWSRFFHSVSILIFVERIIDLVYCFILYTLMAQESSWDPYESNQ